MSVGWPCRDRHGARRLLTHPAGSYLCVTSYEFLLGLPTQPLGGALLLGPSIASCPLSWSVSWKLSQCQRQGRRHKAERTCLASAPADGEDTKEATGPRGEVPGSPCLRCTVFVDTADCCLWELCAWVRILDPTFPGYVALDREPGSASSGTQR